MRRQQCTLRRFNVFVLFLLLSISAVAQKVIIRPEYVVRKVQFGLESATPVPQPVVGLALSGGGARGLAQIGVLRALVEKHVPIELICGTSMGSIVGGLFSLGYSVDELDSIARFTDWNDLLSSSARVNRRELFLEKKLTEDKSVFSLRIKGLHPVLPTSINDGQKLTNYLNILSFQAPIRLHNSFDELETRFRAVSTDLVRGRPVVLRSGSIAQALRASSSVSFLLSPIAMDSMLLVDGGLVANIPVEITHNEGASFVVAVNTTSELHTRPELDLPWYVADQIISIPMQHLNEFQLQKANFIITPKMPNIISTEFQSIDSAIALGYAAAAPLCDSLNRMLKSLFLKELAKTDTTFTNPVLVSAPSYLMVTCSEFFKAPKLDKSDILFFLYALNQYNDYQDLAVEIEGRNDTSFVTFTGKLNPSIETCRFIGNILSENDSVSHIMNTLIGIPYSAKKVMRAAKEILSFYRDLGYSLAEIDSINFNPAIGELTFSFNPGVVSQIEIDGLTGTKPRVIRREIPMENGEVFQSSNFKQALANLRALNIFNNIVVSFERRKAGNVLIFRVDEKGSGIARFGFKMDNENLPQGNLDIRDENLFGVGSEVGLTAYMSQRARAFSIDHRANRLFDSYYNYAVTAFYRFNDVYTYSESKTSTADHYEKDQNGEYRQIFYGFSFALGRQVERLGDLVIRGNFEMNRAKNLRDDTILEFQSRIASIRISTNVDTQDKYPYPTKGLRFNAYYEIASAALGSDLGYTNFGGEYLIHIPLGQNHTISTGARIGFADRTLPLTQEYSLGGQYSFFGMRENELRGRQIFLSSIEYRHHLPFKIFVDSYLQFRYDLGSVWEVQNELKLADFHHGIGTTLSFDTPIGPADISVGRSFVFTGTGDSRLVRLGPVCFYFSIGFYY